MKTHRDLDVWNEGIELVFKVYKAIQGFPKEERFGLASQLKRSAVSIPSNIAEGAARSSRKEFLQYLRISLGSASELETQLIIADKLGFIRDKEIFEYLEIEKRKLLALIKSLRKT